jgi:hypothetical protein
LTDWRTPAHGNLQACTAYSPTRFPKKKLHDGKKKKERERH